MAVLAPGASDPVGNGILPVVHVELTSDTRENKRGAAEAHISTAVFTAAMQIKRLETTHAWNIYHSDTPPENLG